MKPGAPTSAPAPGERNRRDRDNTLDPAELRALADVATVGMPWYSSAVQSSDGQSWMVIEPLRPDLKRFTICRVDGCLMMMVDDPRGDRQLYAAASLDIAIDALRRESRPSLAEATLSPLSAAVH